MKQPIGIILSAIVLSLAALFLLTMTALMAVAGIFADRQSTTAAVPHFAIFLIVALSIVYAILAVWAILTVIGILRLRIWARYSILILAGGFAALGVLLTFGTALSRTMLASMPTRGPAPDPHLIAAIFTVLISFYVVITAIGIWWLIYFNLRSTRELFQTSESTLPQHATAGTLAQRPPAITILACLFLLSAVCCVIMAFTPFPGFLLGFILPPAAAHTFYLAFALIAALLSFGLLKLQEYARVATIAIVLLGFCNVLLSLLPWYQSQFRLYMARFQMAFPAYPNQTPALFPFTRIMVYITGMLGLAFYVVVLWLLHRHRKAFQAAPLPPPMPTLQA
jgi:hypothetical protein